MGKRKKSKGASQPTDGGNRTAFHPVWLIGAVLIVLGAVYFTTRPSSVPAVTINPNGSLIELRPLLSPAMFTGKAARAYRYAAEIPKIIDSQFCYCYCKKDHGHKTLLTCFTNRHGSKCDVCMDEVIYAYELAKQGKSIDEIVVAVDKRFYRPYKPHRF